MLKIYLTTLRRLISGRFILNSVYNSAHTVSNLSAFLVVALLFSETAANTDIIKGYSIENPIIYLVIFFLFSASFGFHVLYRRSINKTTFETQNALDELNFDSFLTFVYPNLKSSLRQSTIVLQTNILPSMVLAYSVISLGFFIDVNLALALVFLVSVGFIILILFYVLLVKLMIDELSISFLPAFAASTVFTMIMIAFSLYVPLETQKNEPEVNGVFGILVFILVLRIVFGAFKSFTQGTSKLLENVIEYRRNDNKFNLTSESSFDIFFLRRTDVKAYKFLRKLQNSGKFEKTCIPEKLNGSEIRAYKGQGFYFVLDDIFQGLPRKDWMNYIQSFEFNGNVVFFCTSTQKLEKYKLPEIKWLEEYINV